MKLLRNFITALIVLIITALSTLSYAVDISHCTKAEYDWQMADSKVPLYNLYKESGVDANTHYIELETQADCGRALYVKKEWTKQKVQKILSYYQNIHNHLCVAEVGRSLVYKYRTSAGFMSSSEVTNLYGNVNYDLLIKEFLYEERKFVRIIRKIIALSIKGDVPKNFLQNMPTCG